jgi:copper homeostasis protein
MRTTVEICVETRESALRAQEGGAHRVELCTERACGGLTPSAEEIAGACRELDIPVHVLIRPRDGDFVYSDHEFEQGRAEIRAAKSLGASGIVLGGLRADGTIDRDHVEALVALSRPLCVTFHKAFDETPDTFEALDVLIAIGIERVLTAGHAATARNGVETLAALVVHACGKIVVMAGGGITEADLSCLAAAGIHEIHAGSCVLAGGRTDSALVRRLVDSWIHAHASSRTGP